MLILLTNDDGIYAPGLAAMERELEQLGDVYVVAPATEQSGVGHSITYLSPLVVSGINGGLNAGINVLYSGTVAAAIEGAFFGITSVAVSLEFNEQARFDRAATLARHVIEQILAQQKAGPQLYNLNIPTSALTVSEPHVHDVPMGLARSGEQYEKRIDPRGRSYFWALYRPCERAM